MPCNHIPSIAGWQTNRPQMRTVHIFAWGIVGSFAQPIAVRKGGPREWGHQEVDELDWAATEQGLAHPWSLQQLSYTPSVHLSGVERAFDQAVDTSTPEGSLSRLVRLYAETGVQKETQGTCKTFTCKSSYGPTDCLLGKCLCQDGYGTLDGQTCVAKPESNILPIVPDDTGFGCTFSECSPSRGPQDCVRSKVLSRCHCKTGFAVSVREGLCVPLIERRRQEAERELRFMMAAGSTEPDVFSCLGSSREMASQVSSALVGKRIFNTSLCRVGIQAYHASPLPLVFKSDLAAPPEDNGYTAADNYRDDLYSLMNLRQWRTSLVQLMARQFVSALLTPDVSEGAKRLGNLFHVLGDSFSGAHVIREQPESNATASIEACGALRVRNAISMDVVNWQRHVSTDKAQDILYECTILYSAKVVQLWADARAATIQNASVANDYVDTLLQEVLCPAYPMDADTAGSPAGGATAYFSSDSYPWGGGKPILPRGLAAPDDARRIVEGWSSAIAAYRSTLGDDDRRHVPFGLRLPERDEDACIVTALAHVEDAQVTRALAGELEPQYLQRLEEE